MNGLAGLRRAWKISIVVGVLLAWSWKIYATTSKFTQKVVLEFSEGDGGATGVGASIFPGWVPQSVGSRREIYYFDITPCLL
jgi:hypothetical protein